MTLSDPAGSDLILPSSVKDVRRAGPMAAPLGCHHGRAYPLPVRRAGYATLPNTRAASLCSASHRPRPLDSASSFIAPDRLLMLTGHHRNLDSMAANLRRLSADWQVSASPGWPKRLIRSPAPCIEPATGSRSDARAACEPSLYRAPRLKEMYLPPACRRPRTAACSRAVPHLAPVGGSGRCPVTLAKQSISP